MSKKCVNVFVTGKVQGVYFRLNVKNTAERHSIFGWVKNLPDGRVEALLQGDESSVDAVVEWAHHGPAGSRVDDVKVVPCTDDFVYTDFVITY